MPTLNQLFGNTSPELVRVTNNTSIVVLPGDTPSFTYENGTYQAGDTTLLATNDASVLVLKNGTTANTGNVISVAVDYSGYLNRLANSLESIVEFLDVNADTDTIGTSILGINQSLDVTVNNSFANNNIQEAKNLVTETNNVYNEFKTRNDLRKITRLILEFDPTTESSSANTSYGDGDEDIPEEAVEITTIVNAQTFIEGEIVNGPSGQGVVTSSFPVKYENLISYNEQFQNGNTEDFSEDNYSVKENNFKTSFQVIDLVSVSGTFTTGQTVTGNITNYSSDIIDIFVVDGGANYSIGNGTNADGDDPLTVKQQRALILSALKQSGTIDNLIQEIRNPTTIPNG